MGRSFVATLCLALLPLLLLLPASASASPMAAASGPLALGEHIFDVGPLPDDLAVLATLAAPGDVLRAGYRCEAVGVLWTWLARWSCQPVIYAGTRYYEDPSVTASVARAYPSSDAVALGWWARHGRWLLLGGLVAAIVVPVARRRPQPGEGSRNRNEGDESFDEDEDEPLDDPGGSVRRGDD